MSQDIDAIYDKGVLRPLEPLDLPDGARVHLRVEQNSEGGTSLPRISAAELKQQQDALDAMFQEVDQLPQRPRNDGLSGRDHDKILYGSGK